MIHQGCGDVCDGCSISDDNQISQEVTNKYSPITICINILSLSELSHNFSVFCLQGPVSYGSKAVDSIYLASLA